MIRAGAIFVILGTVVAACTTPAVAASQSQSGQTSVWQLGIWKSAPAPKNPNGQFGNQDPFALAHGEHIHTDCSIFWIDPANDKLYCFNSGTSKEFFAENPRKYINNARAAFRDEKRSAGTRQR